MVFRVISNIGCAGLLFVGVIVQAELRHALVPMVFTGSVLLAKEGLVYAPDATLSCINAYGYYCVTYNKYDIVASLRCNAGLFFINQYMWRKVSHWVDEEYKIEQTVSNLIDDYTPTLLQGVSKEYIKPVLGFLIKESIYDAIGAMSLSGIPTGKTEE